MEYRKLGSSGVEVSAVSLGTEYLLDLPREHVVGVIREAAESGVNYFDLFYAQSEFRDNMGAAFDGLRDKVNLTAHLGAVVEDGQSAKTRETDLAVEYFEDFLRRYRTDYADVLFVHNCDGEEDFAAATRTGGLLEKACELRSAGRARAVGFSTHTVETARRALETGEINVLMFPVNPGGHGKKGRRELFEECRRRGAGLVAMKPFAGGRLLAGAGRIDFEQFNSGTERRGVPAPEGATPVRLVSYALSRPGVSCVVPGCKDTSELRAALSYLEASPEERDFSDLLGRLGGAAEGECVYCNHCLPCPAGIDVAAVMRLLDSARAGRTDEARAAHAGLEAGAGDCLECGACTERCPFGVQAQERIGEARAVLGG